MRLAPSGSPRTRSPFAWLRASVKADAGTLGDVTGKAIDKQLALLLDGKVLSAPTIKDPITVGKVSFGFATASEADQVAADLGASATS